MKRQNLPGRLAGPQQRAGVSGMQRHFRHHPPGGPGLFQAAFAQPEARQPTVDDLVRVVDIAVPDEPHGGFRRHCNASVD
jgi:hypothetical protein